MSRELIDSILMEMDREAQTTLRLLEAIPAEKLSWRPHPKSMSLGALAMHIAQSQAQAAEIARAGEITIPDFPPIEEAASVAQILSIFSDSLANAKAVVNATDDADAQQEWRMVKDGETIMAMPRAVLWRTIMMNHTYHHRGQLSVYLRELDVPLPPIYGPSADANPFN